jgi:hypothetical protein
MSGIAIRFVCVAACLVAVAWAHDVRADTKPAANVYRFEKNVVAYAWKPGEAKVAGEAYFVGVCATHVTGDKMTVEEFMTGGLTSDLGEELPPRPAGDPIRRAYTLDAAGDVARPIVRRGGLVVWTLPFTFFLLPTESPANILSVKHGVRSFRSHAGQPAVRGLWAWRLADDGADTYEIAGPCEGKFDGDFPLAGCLSRVVAKETGAIRAATASLAITMPVATRLQALSDAPDRRAEEEQFLRGFEAVVAHESLRMHVDQGDTPHPIELPGSLSTAVEKLRALARPQ